MSGVDLTPEAVAALAEKMERTQVLAVYEGGTLEQCANADGAEAAATLRALSARLAEVKAERNSIWQANLDLQRKRDKAEAALATARADALREAAKAVVSNSSGVMHSPSPERSQAHDDILALIPQQEKPHE